MESASAPPKDDLELVRQMLDRGEFDEIREMAKLWRGIKALGTLGTAIVKIAALVGSLYGVWYAASSWFYHLRDPRQ